MLDIDHMGGKLSLMHVRSMAPRGSYFSTDLISCTLQYVELTQRLEVRVEYSGRSILPQWKLGRRMSLADEGYQ